MVDLGEMTDFLNHFVSNSSSIITIRGTHGSIKFGPTRVLIVNRELRIADHYLRPLSEPYINI